ncbi:MAG: NADH-quinone oxidoreductase subunit C [Candidatus Micrarchaeaceae archaeon]
MQEIQREALLKTLEELKYKGFNYLKYITAADFPDKLEVVYIISDIERGADEVITVPIKKSENTEPSIHTVIELFPAADWYEREVSEMFGIKIEGRKAPRLLLEEWNGKGYPLLKSFEWGKDYEKR